MATTAMPTNVHLGGRPASHRLRSTHDTTRVLVDHVLAHTECQDLVGDPGRGQVAGITEACVLLAADVLDSGVQPSTVDLARLRRAAGHWARQGVPLGAIQHAFHQGFSVGLRMIGDIAEDGEHSALVDGAVLMFGLLDVVSEAVSSAYLTEYRSLATQNHEHAHEMITALLAGDPCAAKIAERIGFEMASVYEVVAVHFGPHPDECGPPRDRERAAARKLQKMYEVLADSAAPSPPLAILSPAGGTILVPDAAPGAVDALVERMRVGACVPVFAATATSVPERVAEAAENAYELLRLVRRLRHLPGVYRIADLALEFQIARPGVGQRHLQKLLDPLRSVPDLLPTLQAFVHTEANRKKAAKQLVVHPNTVDYRLKRIEQITGIDPMKSSGLRCLHAALIADSLIGPADIAVGAARTDSAKTPA